MDVVKHGQKAVSLEDGPLAGHGRYTFDKRGLRMTQALAEYNEYRQELIEQSRKLVEEARGGEDGDTPNPQDPPSMDEFGF